MHIIIVFLIESLTCNFLVGLHVSRGWTLDSTRELEGEKALNLCTQEKLVNNTTGNPVSWHENASLCGEKTDEEIMYNWAKNKECDNNSK